MKEGGGGTIHPHCVEIGMNGTGGDVVPPPGGEIEVKEGRGIKSLLYGNAIKKQSGMVLSS